MRLELELSEAEVKGLAGAAIDYRRSMDSIVHACIAAQIAANDAAGNPGPEASRFSNPMDKNLPFLSDITRWLIQANEQILTVKPSTYNEADTETMTRYLSWLPGFLGDIVEQAELLKQRVEEVHALFTGPR